MKTRILVILLSLCFSDSVFGQMWSNPITGANPSTSDPYTTGQSVAANLSVSGIGRGPSINPNSGTDRYNARTWNTTTINANRYFYFTLTPDVGYEIDFSDFEFTGETSNTGPVNFSLRSSIDGYATDIWAESISANSTFTRTCSLIAATYQNINTVITFRIFAWGASATGGTFSVNNFSFNGGVGTATASSSASDYFRSISSGFWGSASTWQSSPDNLTWIASTLVPDNNATAITIRSTHNVTINAAASSKNLTVDIGGTLTHTNGIAFNIANGPNAYDFVVNGTYIINGTQPVLTGSTAGQINGTVTANDNTGGESDDFARNPRITFTNGSIFQWNTTQAFETGTSGIMTYFPNSPVGVTPIFRVTSVMGNLGSNNTTLFNGKFEVTGATSTISFVNTGTKIFRDGLGGDGTITHQILNPGNWNDCGVFMIGDFLYGNPTTPVIDGSLKINILNSVLTVDMEIDRRATVTVSGTPTINIGTASSIGSTLWVSGTLVHNSVNPILLTYGNLTDTGFISGTGTFTVSSINTTITAGKMVAGSLGTLNFTTGASTVANLNMGLTAPVSSSACRLNLGTSLSVSNNIVLSRGILVTGSNLLTWNNAGGTLTSPATASYINSFIATCDANGNPLIAPGLNATTTTTFTGNVGFRILNVRNFAYVNFPVSSDFSRPNRMSINPGNPAPSDITVVVGKGDIMFTPQPRVNRIWYVHTSNQTNVDESGIRLFFTKYNWNLINFGAGQDEIEDGFNPAAVYVGRRDYTNDPHLTHRSPIPRNIGSLGTQEDSVEYQLNTGIGSFVPAYYKFSAGNFGTIILPVTVTNVRAAKDNNKVNIYWSALNETNVQKYEVERSANGSQFKTITSVAARNNGNALNEYASADITPLQGKNFYRIRITDKDGKISYSQVVSLDITDGSTRISVIPNPVHNKQMNIQFANIQAGRYDVLLYTITGELIYKKIIDHSGGSATQNITLPASIAKGAYIVRLQNSLINYKLKVVIE